MDPMRSVSLTTYNLLGPVVVDHSPKLVSPPSRPGRTIGRSKRPFAKFVQTQGPKGCETYPVHQSMG